MHVRPMVRRLIRSSTSASTDAGTDTTTGSTGQSPPDRIVASYAMAAHAAALANHQPVSKAAEAFLSATNAGGTRSRTSKRHRSLLTSGAGNGQTLAVRSSASEAPAFSKPLTGSGDGSSERRAGWSRVVDKAAASVTYISPDGSQLKNKEQVYTYFRRAYPYLTDRVVYRDLIESYFVFSPSATAPMLESDFDLLSVLQPTTSLPSSQPLSTMGSGQSTECLSNGKTLVSDQAESVVSAFGVNNSSDNVCRISFNPNVVSSASLDGIKRRRLSGLSSVSATAPLPATANQSLLLPSPEPAVHGGLSNPPPDDNGETIPAGTSSSASTVTVVSPAIVGMSKEVVKPPPADAGTPTVTTAEVKCEEPASPHRNGACAGITNGETVTSQSVPAVVSLATIGETTTAAADDNVRPFVTSGYQHQPLEGNCSTETLEVCQSKSAGTTTLSYALFGGDGQVTLTAAAADVIPAGNRFTKMSTETLTTAALSQLIPHASSLTSRGDSQTLHADSSAVNPHADQLTSLSAFSQMLAASRFVQQQQQQQMPLFSVMAANRGVGVVAGLANSAVLAPTLLAAQPQQQLILGGAPVTYGTGWLPGGGAAAAQLPVAWPADGLSVASSASSAFHQHHQQQLIAAALLHQHQQSQMAGSVLQNFALLQQQRQQQQQQLAFITAPQTSQSSVSLAQLQSYLSLLQQQQQFAPR